MLDISCRIANTMVSGVIVGRPGIGASVVIHYLYGKERQVAGKKDLNPVVVSALKGCTTEHVVKDTFEKYAISVPAAQIDYLNAAMGDPQTFFSTENPPIEVKHEVTLRMFLAGTWKLAALYEKAGL